MELIGKRWTGAVVRALMAKPARFNQLLAGIPGISDRVLTERLRELEVEGILERLVDPGPPVRVSYRLTARGRALDPVVNAVDDVEGLRVGVVGPDAAARAEDRPVGQRITTSWTFGCLGPPAEEVSQGGHGS